MAIVEVNFPRGKKASEENKKVSHHERLKKPDNLFKSSAAKKNKRRENRKNFKAALKSEKEELESMTPKQKKNAEKEKTMLSSIENLTYKMLTEGMKVLGKVQEVRDMDLLVCLPGRIQAVVPITSISTPYTDLLDKLAKGEDIEAKGLREMIMVDDIFPCSIKEVTNDGSYKVVASFNPLDVNSDIPLTVLCRGMKMTAAVESVEDHGYVMDVGIPGVRSFLKKDDNLDLSIGQITSVCIIDCQSDDHVATLKLSTDESMKIKQNVEINLATLIPGTKVHVTVSKTSSQGLTVTFGNLIGYIHRDHLKEPNDTVSTYEKGSSLKAIVLYTVPMVNAIYLSVKSSLVDPTENTDKEMLNIGYISEAIVVESTTAGLFVNLGKKFKGFIPVRHLHDNPEAVVDDIREFFPVKSRKRCRVISHSCLDDVYICTLKKSLMEQKKLRYEDFAVGEVVVAKVESGTASGVLVNLGVQLKGYIPKLHWADDPRLKKPELRFRPGIAVTCRVLKVVPEKKSLLLTCKKSLVDESVPAYEHPSQLQNNQLVKGTVALVDKGGVLVTFFGNLTGWMPRGLLAKRGVSDMNQCFFVGQLVDCVVDEIQESGKVILAVPKSDSGDTSVQPKSQSNQQPNPQGLVMGTIVSCKVEKVVETSQGASSGLEVSILKSDQTGFIPAGHLSDFPKCGPLLLQDYKPGQVIDEAVVWMSSRMQTILTLKPSILKYLKEGNAPRSVDEVTVNMTYPCVTDRHTKFGIFSTLLCPPNNNVVLFPFKHMPVNLYNCLSSDDRNASMLAEVVSVDKETKKIAAKPYPVFSVQASRELLNSFLQERERIRAQFAASSDESLEYLANLKLGDAVVGKLETECSATSDVEFNLTNGLKAIVPVYHRAKKALKKNDMVAGSVLFCDLLNQVVYVTTREDVISQITGLSKGPSGGVKSQCSILLNTDYITLVAYEDKGQKHVAFVSNMRNLNDAIMPTFHYYPIGVRISVLIETRKHGKIGTYQNLPKEWRYNQNKRRAPVDMDEPSGKVAKKDEGAQKEKTNNAASEVNGHNHEEAAGGTKTKEAEASAVTTAPDAAGVGKKKTAAKQAAEAAPTTKSKGQDANKAQDKKKTNKKTKADDDEQRPNETTTADKKETTEEAQTVKKTGKQQWTVTEIDPEQSTEPSAEAAKGQTKNGPATKRKNKENKADASSKNATAPKTKAKVDEKKKEDQEEQVSPAKKGRVEKKPEFFMPKVDPLTLPRLSITTAFKWDYDMASLPLTSSAAPDSSDSETEDPNREKVAIKDRRERARVRLAKAKEEEAKLSKIEQDLNNPDRAPTTADDFDRMVLSSPNSSILWLQYMAFHLENADIEKARTVAQRAIKTISFREDQEKFNVWIGLLNLEHMYGTTDLYEAALQEALRYNDPFKVHRQMALNFEQSGKFEEAEGLHNLMLKKYKQDKTVWMNACLFYVRNSKLDTARALFQRALSVLDKKTHVEMISRFAQLEMRYGQIARAKTLFDTLMMSYPKRTDLWMVYIDALTKSGDKESAREVLERCITLQLPAKKMKSMFQKFLEFETHHGDEQRQEYVRRKALEYVEAKTDTIDE